MRYVLVRCSSSVHWQVEAIESAVCRNEDESRGSSYLGADTDSVADHDDH